MDIDRLESFYGNLNFELVTIDDRDTLFFELSADGEYATVTDEDGQIPDELETPLIWSVYDENDSFQWSVTIENSFYLEELFQNSDSIDSLLNTLRDIRSENIARVDVF